jgi:molybdopterin synthase catalytic subunit
MFRLTDLPITAHEGTDPSAGARVVFTGLVRDHNEGRRVLSLEYEAMEALAAKEGSRIVEEALHRFEVTGLDCVHRVGHLQIGDVAVQATALAAHRRAAFDACQYVIEEVKRRVPIWKREHYADGTSEWVNAAEVAPAEGPAVLVDSLEALEEWTLIDVRDEDETAEQPLPFPHLRSPGPAFDRALLAEGRALLVCASGIRALILADDLRREGHKDVWSLTGGAKTLVHIARKSRCCD